MLVRHLFTHRNCTLRSNREIYLRFICFNATSISQFWHLYCEKHMFVLYYVNPIRACIFDSIFRHTMVNMLINPCK